jgi:hypothetical protein
MEIVGEFLGIDTEKGLYEHFRRYSTPSGSRPSRKFTVPPSAARRPTCGPSRRCSEKHLLDRIDFDPEVSLIDSFPVPTCRFARAYRCRRLAEESAFGYDEMSTSRPSTDCALT